MTVIERALALFKDGVPTLATFKSDVWRPSHYEDLGSDKDALAAIYHYIDAYNSLKAGRINSAYGILFNWRMKLYESLPESLDQKILISMHESIIQEKEQQKLALINARETLLQESIEKVKEAMRELRDELEESDIEIYIDGSLESISITDKKTNKVFDVHFDDIDN